MPVPGSDEEINPGISSIREKWLIFRDWKLGFKVVTVAKGLSISAIRISCMKFG